MPADLFIGLGTNLGDRLANLRGAVRALRTEEALAFLRCSPVYETRAVGGPPGQGNYLNAVGRMTASCGPERVLEILRDLERRLGRRAGERWGPRAIDLDLLLYNQLVRLGPALTLPHPRMHLRRFVLVPLADLAPEARHPVLGLSVREMLARLPEDDTVIGPVEFEPGLEATGAQGPFSGLETAP